jgi:hypothetical protein
MLRKIKTQEEIDKAKKRNQMIIGGVLILIMVLSSLGFSLLSRDDSGGVSSIKEGNKEFFLENGFWKLDIGGQIAVFRYLPSELEDVSIEGSYDLNKYISQPVYFINVNESEGISEILNNLGGYFLRYQEACLNNSLCDKDLPVKDCDENLIIFEGGNESRVYQNESCVYLSGDHVKSADVFLYKVLKIS